MAYEKKPDELGALWLKRGARGPYMTGTINGEKVICFPGKGGEGDKLPAWDVKKQRPREDAPAPAPVQSDDINW